jgi:hypothetical protein
MHPLLCETRPHPTGGHSKPGRGPTPHHSNSRDRTH